MLAWVRSRMRAQCKLINGEQLTPLMIGAILPENTKKVRLSWRSLVKTTRRRDWPWPITEMPARITNSVSSDWNSFVPTSWRLFQPALWNTKLVLTPSRCPPCTAVPWSVASRIATYAVATVTALTMKIQPLPDASAIMVSVFRRERRDRRYLIVTFTLYRFHWECVRRSCSSSWNQLFSRPSWPYYHSFYHRDFIGW